MDTLRGLFSSNGFMPHGYCYLWNGRLVWLHIVSDALIFLSYLSISLTLLYFLRKRRDVPFHWMFAWFGVFIVACGFTHGLEIWTLWHATYWLSGAVKAITASASLVTATFLIRFVPAALTMPSPEQVRVKEESFHMLVGQVKDYAIFMLDPEGRVMTWNEGAERIKGYGREEIIGRHFSCFYTPEDIARHRPPEELEAAAKEGRFEDESWRVRKDGSRFWANVLLTALKDDTGKLRGFSKITRDITARKHAEAELQALNRELQQKTVELTAANQELEAFTYSVSHDLRAPLRHVDGFSKLLVEKHRAELSPDALEYVATIRDSAIHMGMLIDDLLNLARVGRKPLDMQVTGLNSLVEEVRKDLNQANPDRAIAWKVETLPFVECDPALMKQVFVNLLSNAVKFTRPRNPAVIDVGVISQDGARAVFVRDNGVGFSMKYAKKLFGVFQRLHRSEDFEGTGVGLATVQRIIHKHRGRVWAEAALDKGATFYFTVGSPDAPLAGTAESGAN
jgi:PAS domain S-box-containing protein